MALYFQWDNRITIPECESDLESERFQINVGIITSLIFPMLTKPAWGFVSNAASRAYNNIYCAVRNTPNRLDTLYGYQNTFYINGLQAMWELVLGLDGLPQPLSLIPFVGFIFNWMYYAINALALVWNWDWASVDDSAIVPEAVVKPKETTNTDDGEALIGG